VIYGGIRDWVDRQWRSDGQWRVLLLPAILPLLTPAILGSSTLTVAIPIVWFVAWNAFVLWRWWLHAKDVSATSDHHYDRFGKLKLAREYHGTESATAARARKKKHHG
jgi:hypothetical protein